MSMPDPGGGRVLVIKMGALGDFVQALGTFAAIRAHHGGVHITLLTTPSFAEFAESLDLFNEIWADRKPCPLEMRSWFAFRKKLRARHFTRVYDLQTSGRSSFYYRLFWPGPYPQWSGIARGCSHPHANPMRDDMHTIERQAEQLHMAGIDVVPPPDLSRVTADVARFGLPETFALMVPGGAPHRPAKRWPAPRFSELAQRLADRGITPVLLGTEKEAAVLEEMGADCPDAVNLAGQTTFADIAVLGREAVLAVGNDTGPMHLIAAAGCKCAVLYSHESDPALCAPRGREVTILQREALDTLSVDEVAQALDTP